MNENIICVILAYLIGGVPFGLILGKFFGGVDIRAFGSHSIGATNVLRVIKEKDPKKGKILAIATALCDIFKGVIPILIARAFDVSLNTQWSMAVFAVLGHCFSPYLVFKGGKGVATAAGVLACFVPAEVAIAVVGWFVCGKVLKISSLASLAAILCFAVALYFIHPQMQGINTYAPIVVIIFTIIYKHIPNIVRLIKGDEKKGHLVRILVENLKFKTVIGILDFEREKEQEICVNAKFEADEFIDYAEICKDICGIFKKRKFRLVEDALNFFDDYYRVKFKNLKYFYMKILKTEILPNAKVGAEIEKKY